ncbi:MAG: lipoyl domain-containing protein [Steroidobacteraceae bacterium]|jgi:pyruvate/2-oxoglutarate dehydrogenase complex dihydrolipoamide acyltransferase (E2) component|nr:lipoyl domain-containing protein [Steroidobacteraceae bacterium]
MMEITLPDEAWEGTEAGAEALLDAWLVARGDRVEAGQVIGHVAIVKAIVDLVAPAAGVVESLEVAAEENFPRGRVLARLRTD